MNKKILTIVLLSGFFILTMYIGFLYYNTEKENIELKKKIEVSVTEKPNEKVETLIEQYSSQELQKEQLEELKTLSSTILDTLYQVRLEGEYSQVPLIEQYLTDDGIKKLLVKMNPAKYQNIEQKTIDLVRTADKTNISQTRCQVLEKEIYVDQTDRQNAKVLLLYELSYDSDIPTSSLLVEFGFQYDTEWKMTDVFKLKQF